MLQDAVEGGDGLMVAGYTGESPKVWWLGAAGWNQPGCCRDVAVPCWTAGVYWWISGAHRQRVSLRHWCSQTEDESQIAMLLDRMWVMDWGAGQPNLMYTGGAKSSLNNHIDWQWFLKPRKGGKLWLSQKCNVRTRFTCICWCGW